MDRLFFSKIEMLGLSKRPKTRWMFLTAILSLSAFVVANAVPFFKDLVALIGALTSVPLCLHLPAIFFRRYLQVHIWLPTGDAASSYALLVFASFFMVAALVGSISSIGLDWSSHKGAFACH
jgi:amino acid permease